MLELDPAQTQIEFTLPGTIRAVHGTFKLKSGTIRFNRTTGPAAVDVDMTSEESDNVSLDRKILEEVLETRKYPEAAFIPDHIDGRLVAEGESALQLSGTFRLHGIEHELMVETTETRNGDQLTAHHSFPIPYVDWGLRNPERHAPARRQPSGNQYKGRRPHHPAAGQVEAAWPQQIWKCPAQSHASNPSPVVHTFH